MELLTVKEVAEFLKVSKSLVYTLIAQKQLSCIRIGLGRGTIRVAREELLRFLNSANQEPSPVESETEFQSLKFISVNKTT